MGTNYYYLQDSCGGSHIGKRSFAGSYCWDCKITLCEGGDKFIHRENNTWHKTCPNCKKPRYKVGACCSFSWDIPPEDFKNLQEATLCPTCTQAIPPGTKLFSDEYGKKFTKEELQKIIEECPIHDMNHLRSNFC